MSGDDDTTNRQDDSMLKDSGVCGFGNPHVPNTQGGGCWSPGDPFDNVASAYYWSATSSADNPSNAWLVFLGSGFALGGNKTGSGLRVVAVRGGP